MTTAERRLAAQETRSKIAKIKAAEPAITHVELGRQLGISEGAVRKHLRLLGMPAQCRCRNCHLQPDRPNRLTYAELRKALDHLHELAFAEFLKAVPSFYNPERDWRY